MHIQFLSIKMYCFLSHRHFLIFLYSFSHMFLIPHMNTNILVHKIWKELMFFRIFIFSVSPESIVIPIVSCIFGFPLLALLVICCLRHRAKMARERDRRRNYDLQDHAVSLVRFSPIHRLSESCTEKNTQIIGFTNSFFFIGVFFFFTSILN